MDTTMDRDTLGGKLLPELQQIAQTMGVEGAQKLRKAGLIDAIVAAWLQRRGRGQARPRQAHHEARRRRRDASECRRGAGSRGRRVARPPPMTPSVPRPRDRGDRPTATAATRTAATRTEATRTAANARTAATPTAATPTAATADRGNTRPRQATGTAAAAQDRGNQDRDGLDRDRRRRPSREERRRQRDERRVREEADRAEEVKTAPSRTGILDILPEGYGFLRTSGYLPGPDDVYVSLSHVRKHLLRKGDTITGKIREPKNNEKYPALLLVESVNDMDPDAATKRPQFDKLTPLFPNERFRLENGPLAIAERIVDMVSPIGKGQRGMVVAPPKAGKTTILKQIANGIIKSSPDTHVIVLLVDERPEEVTDWQRTVTRGRGRLLDVRQADRPAHPDHRARARARRSAWPRWATTLRSCSTT